MKILSRCTKTWTELMHGLKSYTCPQTNNTVTLLHAVIIHVVKTPDKVLSCNAL